MFIYSYKNKWFYKEKSYNIKYNKNIGNMKKDLTNKINDLS